MKISRVSLVVAGGSGPPNPLPATPLCRPIIDHAEWRRLGQQVLTKVSPA